MKKNNNKGFTLVEVIVAMTCSTLVVLAVVLILRLAFSNYKTIQLESELQIEAQVLEAKLTSAIRNSKDIETSIGDEGYNAKVKITSNKIEDNIIVPIYYYFINDNFKEYLIISTDNIDIDSVTYSDLDYLANFVEGIKISEYDTNMYYLEINEVSSDVHYTKSSVVYITEGE
jgi:type II secretory pathway pseudopilin PulG